MVLPHHRHQRHITVHTSHHGEHRELPYYRTPQVYQIDYGKPLGLGLHGPVYRAVERKSKVVYAMKTLSISDISHEVRRVAPSFIRCSSTRSHSFVHSYVYVPSLVRA